MTKEATLVERLTEAKHQIFNGEEFEWHEACRAIDEALTSLASKDATIDEAFAAIYGRHERGFVMRPLVDPPSLPEAVAQLVADNRMKDEILTAAVDDYNREKAKLDDAVKALEPFAMEWTDDSGWDAPAPHRDGISDWFGPSDFRRAREALVKLRSRTGGANG